MGQYVALIRGINVGGNNLIKMSELKRCFEGQGLRSVATYIQSGNVLFESSGLTADRLARRIETAIAETFACKTTVVLRSRKQMRSIVERAPKSFGTAPARYRYDTLFLQEPLTAAQAIAALPTKPGVDAVYPGPGVVYFSRVISKATQSRLSRLVSMPMYQQVTIRNWNTTTKLYRLMSAEDEI